MFAAAFATVLAAAASIGTPAPAPTPGAPAPVAPVATAAPADPRVCLVDRVTGSYIPIKVCHKLSDWRAQGIDPLAKRR